MKKEIKKEKPVKKSASADKLPRDKNDFGIDIKKMTEVGVCFGHKTSRLHPKMKPYISGVKNTTHIIDLEKTAKNLKIALEYIQKIISEEKKLLLVGTKIPIKKMIEETAEDCGISYVNERWLGGTFTNFGTIKKRVKYYKELERKKKEREFEKYTKKERIGIDREIKNLERKFKGIKDMDNLPDAIFVLDIKKDILAVKEAEKKGIKIIGIVDTNIDPSPIDFPIPANDDSIGSIKYILEKLTEVIKNSKKKPL